MAVRECRQQLMAGCATRKLTAWYGEDTVDCISNISCISLPYDEVPRNILEARAGWPVSTLEGRIQAHTYHISENRELSDLRILFYALQYR